MLVMCVAFSEVHSVCDASRVLHSLQYIQFVMPVMCVAFSVVHTVCDASHVCCIL